MKRIGFLLVLVMLLTGCGSTRAENPCRVVTGVEVQYLRHGAWVERTYFRQESIQSVLNYLRMLHPSGPVIPEETAAETCRITVHYSQGMDTVYLQQGSVYLQQNGGAWEKIDRQQAQLLYPLLLLLPSDA